MLPRIQNEVRCQQDRRHSLNEELDRSITRSGLGRGFGGGVKLGGDDAGGWGPGRGGWPVVRVGEESGCDADTEEVVAFGVFVFVGFIDWCAGEVREGVTEDVGSVARNCSLAVGAEKLEVGLCFSQLRGHVKVWSRIEYASRKHRITYLFTALS